MDLPISRKSVLICGMYFTCMQFHEKVFVCKWVSATLADGTAKMQPLPFGLQAKAVLVSFVCSSRH